MTSRRSQTPPVGTCVPTSNDAAYFRDCQAGIQAQSRGDFEALIVDDASTASTLAICLNSVFKAFLLVPEKYQ